VRGIRDMFRKDGVQPGAVHLHRGAA